jgi:hypothetical protein
MFLEAEIVAGTRAKRKSRNPVTMFLEVTSAKYPVNRIWHKTCALTADDISIKKGPAGPVNNINGFYRSYYRFLL